MALKALLMSMSNKLLCSTCSLITSKSKHVSSCPDCPHWKVGWKPAVVASSILHPTVSRQVFCLCYINLFSHDAKTAHTQSLFMALHFVVHTWNDEGNIKPCLVSLLRTPCQLLCEVGMDCLFQKVKQIGNSLLIFGFTNFCTSENAPTCSQSYL